MVVKGSDHKISEVPVPTVGGVSISVPQAGVRIDRRDVTRGGWSIYSPGKWESPSFVHGSVGVIPKQRREPVVRPPTTAVPRPQVIRPPVPKAQGTGGKRQAPIGEIHMPTISDIVLAGVKGYTDYRVAKTQRTPMYTNVPYHAAQPMQVDNPFIPNMIEGTVIGDVAACGDGSCGSPRYLTYDCKTGEFRKKRRRRRRPMLTASDMVQLNQIAGLPNNQNVRTALASRIKGS